ncbi:MAG: hypothetical protein ACXIUV_07110 [Alkalilacustris sp.]
MELIALIAFTLSLAYLIAQAIIAFFNRREAEGEHQAAMSFYRTGKKYGMR